MVSVREARALDFLEVLGDDGGAAICNRRTFAVHARQIAGSAEAVAVRAGGELCAIVGVYPVEGELECWFATGPGLRANLLPVLRLVRRRLEVFPALVAYIHPRSVAGDRLARWLGFEPCGCTDSPIGPLNTWRRRA